MAITGSCCNYCQTCHIK